MKWKQCFCCGPLYLCYWLCFVLCKPFLTSEMGRRFTRVSKVNLDEGPTFETSAFRIPVRWSIYIINSVDKTKLCVLLPHRRSTTVSLETTPFDFKHNLSSPYNNCLFLLSIQSRKVNFPNICFLKNQWKWNDVSCPESLSLYNSSLSFARSINYAK